MKPLDAELAIILLAAGSSSRLGSPKQLAHYRGESLLRRVLATTLEAKVGEVFVVTGAHRDSCLAELNSLAGTWMEIHNPDHSRGMGHSLKTAMNWLVHQRPELQAVVIAVCDQLHLEASHLRALCETANDGSTWYLTASRYQEGWGVPALIPKAYFAECLQISDNKGAKELLLRHRAALHWIDFAQGMIDIDTLSDVEAHGLELGPY